MKYSINLSDIILARKVIKKDIVKTPTIFADKISSLLNANVFIKVESLQRGNSFKIRGALNKIANLDAEKIKNGVIAPSAGNHAQGVAIAASLKGIKSYIVMPSNAPETKIAATTQYGGEVILADGSTFDDAFELAKKMSKEKGLELVHAYEDKHVIAGQGTIGLEIMNDIDNVDIIICSIGGGGLISGIAVAAKTMNPKIKIIGVQTESIPSMKNAIDNKKPIKLQNSKSTIADGIAVKQPGKLTFQIIKDLVDQIVLVSEKEIKETINYLLTECKILSEGAGAAPIAAILNKKIDCKDKTVVAVLSGGNIDQKKIIEILSVEKTRSKVCDIELSTDEYNKIKQYLIKNNVTINSIDGENLFDIIKTGKLKIAINSHDESDITKFEEFCLKNKIKLSKSENI